ncbi:MAG: LPS translocon maturation chaperone LptM [Luteimonas sp.]
MKTAALALLLIATSLTLTACGNKGPLVLPDKPAESAVPAVDATPAIAAPSDRPVPVIAPTENTDTPATAEPLPQDDND